MCIYIIYIYYIYILYIYIILYYILYIYISPKGHDFCETITQFVTACET